MKFKIKLTMGDGTPERILVTNMFVICEWERLENKSVQDTIRYSDMVCWAWLLCKLAGDKVPDTWRKWLSANPDLECTAVADENPNLTGLELTEGN
jgi:hypothetical protein